MKNLCFWRIYRFFLLLIVLASILATVSCRTTELTPTIYIPPNTAASKASLVSVRATGSTTAEITVKTNLGLKNTDWQLTAQTADGGVINLGQIDNQPLTKFTLNNFQATGLVVGQAYRFQLRFVYNEHDTLYVERMYQHSMPAHWQRLAHLNMDDGDFTGSLLMSQQNGPDYLSAVRYVTDQQWQALLYDLEHNSWLNSSVSDFVPSYVPRHGLVRFQLQSIPNVTYVFSGLGFLYNSLDQNRRIYRKTMFVRDDTGVKEISYAGPDGEITFFTTLDRAFLLTQEASPQLWVRRGNWDQYRGRDFPEAPGTLATFVLNGIGYVVNQIDGQSPHFYAYNPDTDQWMRRADFPGTPRSRGVGFSAGGRGYFGLGTTGEDERGLRDLWQYDPVTDRWQYVTDYPGQGHRYLIVYSAPDRAYLGWGYESQPSPPGGARQVGCTDFWEFRP